MKPEAKQALVPKLRFPEFREAGGWGVTRLRELLVNHPDYGVNAPAVPYSGNLPTYLRITDISDEGYFVCDKKTSVAISVIDENYLSDGDIVLARTGASVGKSYKFRKEDGKLVFAGFLIRIKPDPRKIDSTFLFNFLSTQQYWDWVGVTSASSGQPGINGNEYATLPIPIPSHEESLSEQQKIAGCLASIDELITQEAQKLDTLKAHKKGLMQQLFPAEGETLHKLRFPEFREAGEWEEKRLGEVINLEYGNSLPESKRKDGAIPVVGSNGIVGYHDEHLVTGPAIVIGRKGSVGQVNWIEQNCYPNDTTYYVKNKNSQSHLLSFLCILLEHSNLPDLKDSSAVPGLSRDSAHSLISFFPQPPEQQKIASCLTSIDDLITVHNTTRPRWMPGPDTTTPVRSRCYWNGGKIHESTRYFQSQRSRSACFIGGHAASRCISS